MLLTSIKPIIIIRNIFLIIMIKYSITSQQFIFLKRKFTIYSCENDCVRNNKEQKINFPSRFSQSLTIRWYWVEQQGWWFYYILLATRNNKQGMKSRASERVAMSMYAGVVKYLWKNLFSLPRPEKKNILCVCLCGIMG